MSQPSGSAAPANLPPASNGGHALLAVNPPPSNPTVNNGGQALFALKSPPNPRDSPPPQPQTPTRLHSGSPGSWMNPFATPGIEDDFLNLSPSLWNSFLELSNELAPETVLHGPRRSLATWTVLPTQDTADDLSASADVSAPASAPEHNVFSACADASVPEREVSTPASAPERDVFSASADVSIPERDVSPASAVECDTLEHNADRPACSGESEDDKDFDELESSVPATPAHPLPTPALLPPPAYVVDPPSPPPVYNPDPFNLAAITPGSRRNVNIPLVGYASNPNSSQSPDRPRSLSPPHSRYLACSNHRLAMAFYSPFGNDCDGAIFKGDFGTRDEESEEEWRMQEEETAEVREAQKEQWALRRMWAQQERIDALEQMGFEEQLMQELKREELKREELEREELEREELEREELEREELEREELEWEELENQVGGGRRQATPPIITCTYLRPVIRRTPNAGHEVDGLLERRKRKMLPPPPLTLPCSPSPLSSVPRALPLPFHNSPPPPSPHSTSRGSLPPSDDGLPQPSSPHSPPDFLAAVEVKPDETGGLSDGADTSAKSKGGRPTKEQLAAVGACHSEMDRLVEKCAGETGLTHQAILRSYHNAPGTTRSSNPWNIYQKYMRAMENRKEEWARLNTAEHHFTTFTPDPDGHPPPLEGQNLKKAWTEFQAAYPDKQAANQLRDWREMDRLCTEVTVGARRRHFRGAGGKVAQILKTLSKRHNFQSLLIFTGSYANEDQQLAMFQSTGGLAQIFTDLRPNLPVLDQHDILGIAKNIAVREEIRFTLLGGDEDDQEADASAASRAVSGV
ncbi:hypothetical protein DFH08DRAFT_956868 [Mycena albidolilacea]|uniref:Uncharacterized protein n=1 Tax=Mycena albidolilacea TaxID=1033008 RepID=A0AAD7A8B6_9AGAR|nr:hypothetical protein DFH08DRAFT_956868 [Mycena albidolilacea]